MIIAIFRSPRFMNTGVHVETEIAVSSLFQRSVERLNSATKSYVFPLESSLPSEAGLAGVGSVLRSLCRILKLIDMGPSEVGFEFDFLLIGVEQLQVLLTILVAELLYLVVAMGLAFHVRCVFLK